MSTSDLNVDRCTTACLLGPIVHGTLGSRSAGSCVSERISSRCAETPSISEWWNLT
jgi:hypothetical protein